jgi:hypothetical protein
VCSRLDRKIFEGSLMQPNKPNSVFPLRLPTTTRIQANELASRDGISLNQFISLAVAEKIVRLQSTEQEPPPANPEVDQTGAGK